MKKYDVVIIGGGTSGCSCAYNCAKNNLSTLLVEKNTYLGGLMTGGLVIPAMNSTKSDLNMDYYKKLVETAKKYNAQITYSLNEEKNDGWFNPEILKFVLDDLLCSDEIKSNLDILFDCQIAKVEVENQIKYKSIKSVVIENSTRTLSIPIVAKHFVDATGSGVFSKMAGAGFLNDTNQKQQSSLRFILGNVDTEKFCNFLKSLNDDWNITNTYRNEIDTNNELHFTTASTWNNSIKWALDDYLVQGVNEGLLKPQDRAYFQIFSVPGTKNQVAFNCPSFDYNSDLFSNSKNIIEARKAIYRYYNFVKKYFSGFENSIIVNIAHIIGSREDRRLKTLYTTIKKDLINQKQFKTPVLEASYGIDIHSSNDTGYKQLSTYQMPLDSLICDGFSNLFAIGKLAGADFASHSALRVQKSCMSMGEGIAKYIREISNN